MCLIHCQMLRVLLKLVQTAAVQLLGHPLWTQGSITKRLYIKDRRTHNRISGNRSTCEHNRSLYTSLTHRLEYEGHLPKKRRLRKGHGTSGSDTTLQSAAIWPDLRQRKHATYLGCSRSAQNKTRRCYTDAKRFQPKRQSRGEGRWKDWPRSNKWTAGKFHDKRGPQPDGNDRQSKTNVILLTPSQLSQPTRQKVSSSVRFITLSSFALLITVLR